MADTHVNRLRCTVSAVASSGLGAFTISTASSGYRTFGASQDGQTFTVVITEGTTWEVSTGCTYTHSGTTLSRGTLADSSTGSAIAFTTAAIITESASADHGRRWDAAALVHVAGTDANTTMAVNTLYVVDMSAWATADRTYTLPAVAAIGDRIGIVISSGNSSTFELVLTAGSGDTLNAVAGGTEWSRVFITGEVVIMRCVTANSGWVVEQDGRIPSAALMYLAADATGKATTTFNKVNLDSIESNLGSIGDSTNKKVTVRRANNYTVLAVGSVSAGGAGTVIAEIYKNGSSARRAARNYTVGPTAANVASGGITMKLVVGDYIELYEWHDSGTEAQQGLDAPEGCRLSVVEVL